MQNLKNSSTLQGGKYVIEKVLGQGGFGITYLAMQSGLERKVAIKEFFMKEFCERDEATSHVTLGTESNRETVNRFREKFLKEARNIARLNHPNIIRIFDVFEENGTAYYVMEYCENGSLADKVKREGALSEAVATHYILQVADALDYIHRQKMNHLDVKPANILLNEKDEAVLIDFGLSKQYDAVTGSQTSTTPVGISNGYAPMEQYRPGGVSEFSPQTDIYSLGATFLMLLTGITPPSASDINEDGVPVDELKAKKVKQKTISVICKAMKGRKKERLQDITSFVGYLKGSTSSSEGANRTSTSKPASKVDDETTVVFVDTKKKEKEDRKRKEAEVKARKEKAETEARAKAEEEAKALAEAERSKRTNAIGPKGFSRNRLWLIALIMLCCIIAFISHNVSKTSLNMQIANREKEIADSLKRVADSIRITDSIQATLQVRQNVTKTTEKRPTKKVEDKQVTHTTTTQAKQQYDLLVIEEEDSDADDAKFDLYEVVEEMPEYPYGGHAGLMQYLSQNVKYPTDAQDLGIQGRVTCKFTVEKDGRISDVKVLRGVHPSLDKEAVRVLSNMPKWKPGKHKEEVVRVHYTIPITFRLQ